MSAAFSAIISTEALRLADGMVGMIEASTTRSPRCRAPAAGRRPRRRIVVGRHAAGAHEMEGRGAALLGGGHQVVVDCACGRGTPRGRSTC
jgi:hypothetical protein